LRRKRPFAPRPEPWSPRTGRASRYLAIRGLGFHTWLARKENLDILGETLGIDLELEAEERAVGPVRAETGLLRGRHEWLGPKPLSKHRRTAGGTCFLNKGWRIPDRMLVAPSGELSRKNPFCAHRRELIVRHPAHARVCAAAFSKKSRCGYSDASFLRSVSLAVVSGWAIAWRRKPEASASATAVVASWVVVRKRRQRRG
jgi:hypothetical protein